MDDNTEIFNRIAACLDATTLPAHEVEPLRKRLQQLELECTFSKTLLDAIPDPAFLKDSEGRYLYVNKAVAHWLGVKNPDDLVGKSSHEIFDKVQADVIRAEDNTILLSGKRCWKSTNPPNVPMARKCGSLSRKFRLPMRREPTPSSRVTGAKSPTAKKPKTSCRTLSRTRAASSGRRTSNAPEKNSRGGRTLFRRASRVWNWDCTRP